jgi:GT2 family glycosyltransferase
MKILVAIPVISGAEHTKMAIDSVVGEADVLVIDNNADDLTKLVLLREHIAVIENDKNEYVNFAWNQSIYYFLESDYDTLIIMNSDLIMQPGWSKKLDQSQICIPTDGSHIEDVVVTEGTPGVFIHLNREMAEIVFPIPDDYIKIWWGDYFTYEVLRRLGYQTVVKAGLIANHYNGGSQSVNIVPDKESIIEQDKANWALRGEADIDKRVAVWTR